MPNDNVHSMDAWVLHFQAFPSDNFDARLFYESLIVRCLVHYLLLCCSLYLCRLLAQIICILSIYWDFGWWDCALSLYLFVIHTLFLKPVLWLCTPAANCYFYSKLAFCLILYSPGYAHNLMSYASYLVDKVALKKTLQAKIDKKVDKKWCNNKLRSRKLKIEFWSRKQFIERNNTEVRSRKQLFTCWAERIKEQTVWA